MPVLVPLLWVGLLGIGSPASAQEASSDAATLGIDLLATTIDTSEVVEPTAEAGAEESGRELARPRIDPERRRRALRSIAFTEASLADERGSANLELAVAVNLYVGGVMLSILSASLLVGIAFEAACINGVIDECMDAPSFLAGAIPSTLGAVALLIGAATTDRRVQSHFRSLDERDRVVLERRRALEPSVTLAAGPLSLSFAGRF